MRKMIAVMALGLLVSCGCKTPYVMKLSNGSQITAPSKPKLKGSTYYYKDAHGQVVTMPQSRVLEIEPASMAADEKNFKPAAPKKHWYQFW